MNIARCLLFEKKIPTHFWAEAVNTAVYLLNRLPTKGTSRQVDSVANGSVDSPSSSRQAETSATGAVDRFRAVTSTSRQAETSGVGVVDRFGAVSLRGETSRQDVSSVEKPVDRFDAVRSLYEAWFGWKP